MEWFFRFRLSHFRSNISFFLLFFFSFHRNRNDKRKNEIFFDKIKSLHFHSIWFFCWTIRMKLDEKKKNRKMNDFVSIFWAFPRVVARMECFCRLVAEKNRKSWKEKNEENLLRKRLNQFHSLLFLCYFMPHRPLSTT